MHAQSTPNVAEKFEIISMGTSDLMENSVIVSAIVRFTAASK